MLIESDQPGKFLWIPVKMRKNRTLCRTHVLEAWESAIRAFAHKMVILSPDMRHRYSRNAYCYVPMGRLMKASDIAEYNQKRGQHVKAWLDTIDGDCVDCREKPATVAYVNAEQGPGDRLLHYLIGRSDVSPIEDGQIQPQHVCGECAVNRLDHVLTTTPDGPEWELWSPFGGEGVFLPVEGVDG
jgi:hypothetical protein